MTVSQQLDALIALQTKAVQLLQKIDNDLGGVAATPDHLQSYVGGSVVHTHSTKGLSAMPHTPFMRPRRYGLAAAPGNVTVTFTWDAASDGGLTASYRLDIFKPDGSPFSSDPVPLGTTFVREMPDDASGVYSAGLTALSAAGVPSTPATTTFSPHIAATIPSTPTGFAASVSP